MTDIVERLRVAAPLPTGLYCEAADVIDALRHQLAEENKAHLIAEQRWIEELNASKANDLFAMRLLAESQAREKVRIEQRKAWKEIAEYQYGRRWVLQGGAEDYPVTGALDAWACGRHAILKNNETADDTALQDLILKERTRAVDTYKHLQQELVLKAALEAEREKCLSIIRNLLNASEPDDFALDALNAAENAIRALES